MKRKLFDELKEGLTALQSAREGKITLREGNVEKIASTNAFRKTGNKAAQAQMPKP